MFTAQRFRFHFRAARCKHAVGVSKSSELSRVSAPTQNYPNRACPTVLPCDEQLLPELLFGREDSCFLHHRLSGYAHAVWEGARRLGVWDARPGSAQRS